MAQPPKTYSRLTRNAAGLGSYSSLWLGPDHVMIVRSTGYNESYSRIQFSDIKGIFLTASNRRAWWAVGWGVIAGWSLIALAITLTSHATPSISVILGLTGIVGLVWNHLLGQGCQAFVATGVQTAELPSLVRLPKARRVVTQLQQLIAAAQAGIATTTTVAPAVPAASEGNTADTAAAAAAAAAPATTPPAAGDLPAAAAASETGAVAPEPSNSPESSSRGETPPGAG